MHRYTFPRHRDARLVIDFSLGGLAIPHGATMPLRAHLESVAPGVAQGEIVVEGAPLAVHIECDAEQWRQMLWYDRRLMPGGTRLDFDHIRPTTLRPFGLMWAGPTRAGAGASSCGSASRCAGSSRRARTSSATAAPAPPASTRSGAIARTTTWRRPARRRSRSTRATAERDTVFATALYHSLIKPCLAPDESPFWPADGPFVFDISTMWDIYRTQLPLLTALAARPGGRARRPRC